MTSPPGNLTLLLLVEVPFRQEVTQIFYPPARRSRCGRRMSGVRRSNLKEQEKLACKKNQPNSTSWNMSTTPPPPTPSFCLSQAVPIAESTNIICILCQPHCYNKPCLKETPMAQTFLCCGKILMHLFPIFQQFPFFMIRHYLRPASISAIQAEKNDSVNMVKYTRYFRSLFITRQTLYVSYLGSGNYRMCSCTGFLGLSYLQRL